MPLPIPAKNQSKDEFISACMSNSVMKREYPENKQRVAVCFSQFKKAKKKHAQGSVDIVNFETTNDFGPFVVIE